MPVAFSDKGKVITSAFLLFCLSLFLTSYTSRHHQIGDAGSSVLSELARPFQVGTDAIHSRAVGIWDGYFALLGIKDENKRLHTRLETLEGENARLKELEEENKRLRNLLSVTEDPSLHLIASDVIGYDPSNWVQAITIDKGSKDGVQSGMAVVESAGIIGQVIQTSPHTARVLLITDHASGVDGLIQDTRVRGVIDGTGESSCEFRFIADSDELNVGDKVVTSGMDGVFPKGLVIGVVSSVEKSSNGLFREVKVTPNVKFTKLETVMVVTNGTVKDDTVPETATKRPKNSETKSPFS